MESENSPWIITLDNIFVDVAIKLPSTSFLESHNLVPGSQYTADTPEKLKAAMELLSVKEGSSEQICKTVGGCAMNTSRAANYYL